MARPMKPLVRGGGYYPSRRWTPLLYPGGYTTANGGGQPEPEEVLKTVTGSLIHITDALALPAEALTVAVEPIQDLHGYDSPWPSGGKNLFNGTFYQGYWAFADGVWGDSNAWVASGKIPCEPSTAYTVSADEKLTRWQGFVWFDTNGNYISTDNLQSNINIGLTKTSPSNAAFMAFNIAGYPSSSSTISPTDVTHFQIEKGESATSYVRPANICPISGWTAVSVTRTGKNLLSPTLYVGCGYNPTIGTTFNTTLNDTQFTANADKTEYTIVTSQTWRYYCLLFPLVDGESYYQSFTFNRGTDSGQIGITYGFLDSEHKVLTKTNNTSTPTTVNSVLNPPTSAKYYYIVLTNRGTASQTLVLQNPQIVLGSTASAYEPYAGNTYTIQLGETVYGGQLDVTGGKMVVDRAMVDLGTFAWGYESSNAQFYSNGITGTSINWNNWGDTPPLLCSGYKPIANAQLASSDFCVGYAYNSKQLRVKDSGFTDAASFKTAMSGVQLVYELATPIEITLTPTQIDTLLGENNLWADAGDLTLTYYADGNASTSEALGILLGGTYNNPGGADDVSDDEALGILLGGS